MAAEARFKYHPFAEAMKEEAGLVFDSVTLDDLGSIRRYVRETAVSLGCDLEAAGELVTAVNEALSNIVRHGYGGRPAEIRITVACEKGMIGVTLLDRGLGFDPTQVPMPDTTLPLEERPFGGMGVHMMRAFCDDLVYRRTADGQNELTLVKRLAAS